MIYWHFRNFQCFIVAFFKSKLTSPTAKVTKTFWANPFDSDWLYAVQAARFFTYTDAARWDVGVRMGFVGPSLKNKWVIISGGQKIIYRRPLRIFRGFQLTVQLTGWDKKWVYAAHVFRQAGDVKCVSFTKLGFRNKSGLVDPHHVFQTLGFSPDQAPPPWVLDQFKDDLTTMINVGFIYETRQLERQWSQSLRQKWISQVV